MVMVEGALKVHYASTEVANLEDDDQKMLTGFVLKEQCSVNRSGRPLVAPFPSPGQVEVIDSTACHQADQLRWQSEAISSKFISEGSLVNGGKAVLVDDALFGVLPSSAINPREVKGPGCLCSSNPDL
ncbi:hypothetical protein LWI28_024586 [Acer negundo]|uniref:Uncharacterized protein n=1 Tax=Acer negundo TaxID=4023 RepID=A0AAD5NKK1_ACENE|nr:hypothetical protein LWI28_024586 [Acer negundo]